MGGGGGQGRDVRAEQPDLVILDQDVALLEIHTIFPQTLYFPAFEGNACLEALLDKEFMSGGFVQGNGIALAALVFRLFGHRLIVTRGRPA